MEGLSSMVSKTFKTGLADFLLKLLRNCTGNLWGYMCASHLFWNASQISFRILLRVVVMLNVGFRFLVKQ